MEKYNSPELLVDEAPSQTLNFSEFLSIVKRQWRVVAACAIVAVVIGIVYAFTAVPRYTATASLLLDSTNQQITQQVLAQQAGLQDDEANVLSQVEILRSDALARAVVKKLDLLNDPVFNANNNSPLGNLIATAKSLLNYKTWFASGDIADDSGPDAKTQQAATLLLKNLTADRVVKTYVLEVGYTSTSPALSARIANAVVEAYLEDQLEAKYDATRRASVWLDDRIKELRGKSLAADMAVQKFRADKGLIATSGTLISDQQLSQLNKQYIDAQTETANNKAKLDSLQKVIQGAQLNASVVESLNSNVINNLQGEFLATSRREAEISSRLGPDHIQAQRLRTQMQEYKRLMFEELSRIAETYKSSYEISKAQEVSLGKQLDEATSKSATANNDQVQLRELERESDTYKQLYESFLQRFQQQTQQQSFPVTTARIISGATVPLLPSYPRKPLVVAIAMLLGCCLGAAIGGYRELGERFFRTGEQVSHELDLEFLGQIPLEPMRSISMPAEERGPRLISPTSSIVRYVVDHPMSSFAETMRSAKIASDIWTGARKGKVIGIVSVMPREGKSTVAINFAEHLAHQGAKTLLIDGDLRNPGATRALAADAEKGIFEVISENEPLLDTIRFDPKTGLAFLPADMKRRLPFSAELLTSAGMDRMLAAASSNFDYIVIDLPPMGPVVDARAVAGKIDCFLMIVEWGETPRRVVKTAIQSNPTIMRRCAGVILNKVDTSKMDLYMDKDQVYYQNTKYDDYYIEEK